MSETMLVSFNDKYRVLFIGRYAHDFDSHEEAAKVFKDLNKDLRKLTFTEVQNKYVGSILQDLNPG